MISAISSILSFGAIAYEVFLCDWLMIEVCLTSPSKARINWLCKFFVSINNLYPAHAPLLSFCGLLAVGEYDIGRVGLNRRSFKTTESWLHRRQWYLILILVFG